MRHSSTTLAVAMPSGWNWCVGTIRGGGRGRWRGSPFPDEGEAGERGESCSGVREPPAVVEDSDSVVGVPGGVENGYEEGDTEDRADLAGHRDHGGTGQEAGRGHQRIDTDELIRGRVSSAQLLIDFCAHRLEGVIEKRAELAATTTTRSDATCL
jgi:hypothetical protein